jgi:hypothetical protein
MILDSQPCAAGRSKIIAIVPNDGSGSASGRTASLGGPRIELPVPGSFPTRWSG